MNQLEYQLDEENKLPEIIEYKWSTKTKVLIGLLISIIIIFIGLFIILLLIEKNNKNEREQFKKEIDNLKLDKKDLEKERDNLKSELNNVIYIINNISYADENTPIINSFKKGGENYIEELGEINDGLNYDSTEHNLYNLYIPYSATQAKNKYNKIILEIHGGAWIGGYKDSEEQIQYCKNLTKLGFITATFGYTLLNATKYKNVNIFRLLDEITAGVKNIKNYLKKEGFYENKLELALSGGSAGAHLSLLYSYLIKNSPIPVKFVINMVGPVTIEPEYFFNLKNLDEPLDNIDKESIEKAVNESKVEKLDLLYNLVYLNIWLGYGPGDDFLEMYNLDTKEINTENDKYKEKMNIAKFAFPINNVEKDSVPTLCIYGGRDIDIGIPHYSLLKSSFDKKGNKNIELIYSKYAAHNFFNDPIEIREKLLSEMYTKILEYSNKYFSKD